MIEYMKPTDSIFDSGAEALVCPVNCVGVMGAGLAKEFKKRFPKYAESYRKACSNNSIRGIGKLHVYKAKDNAIIISFATKFSWRDNSDLLSVHEGVYRLAAVVASGIKSVAIPALGCGLGGLDWNDVRPLVEEAFKDLPDVRVMLYPPKEAKE